MTFMGGYLRGRGRLPQVERRDMVAGLRVAGAATPFERD
jgi:hypothetical protein